MQDQRRPLELTLPLTFSQHTTDVWLLDALRRHPQRTHTPSEASLHILDFPFFTSMVHAWAGVARRLSQMRHMKRMEQLARALEANPYFMSDAPFLVIVGYFFVHRCIGPVLQAVLERGNVILATTDAGYSATEALYERAVLLPYLPSAQAERWAFGVYPGALPSHQPPWLPPRVCRRVCPMGHAACPCGP